MKIDGIDKIIIKTLVKDARTPVLSIAREVGISGAAIHQRLRKLEKSKLIDGYRMVINPKSLGYTTTAFVGIFLDSASLYSSAIKRLKEIPEVVESHYTTGNYAIFIKIKTFIAFIIQFIKSLESRPPTDLMTTDKGPMI